VKLFTKLGWLPIDDIICSRKLYLLHKISYGHCPDYFIPYIYYLKDTHNYNTKATTKNNLVLPKYKRVSGCRTFHTSAIRLWDNVDVSIRTITSQTVYRKNTAEATKPKCCLRTLKLAAFFKCYYYKVQFLLLVVIRI